MNPFSGLSGKERIGVDLSQTTLKMAHMTVLAAKKEIATVLAENIAGLGDSDIAKVAKGMFGKLKVKNCPVISVMPSSMVITKNIEIPSTNPQEIREIISLQAARYTPYSREEIMVDYIDIDTFKNNYTKILLVIVARSAVKRQFEILERAGVELQGVALAPEGLARYVPRAFHLDTVTSPACIINIDESTSDFIIIFKNKPTFMRSISMGALGLAADKEASHEKFLEEIKKSFEAYQSEDIEKAPRQIIVTGAEAGLAGLENLLNDNLQYQARVLDYRKNVAISKDALKAIGPKASFFGVMASLVIIEEMKIGLVPEEIRLKKAVEERGRDLIKTGIFFLGLFILVFSTLISKIYFKSTYLALLNGRYEQVHKEAERLENQFEKVTMIRDYLMGRGLSLDILTEIHKAAPIDLELNEIRYEIGKEFVVKGTAKSMSSVFSFVDNMEKSTYFREVKTRYTTKRREGEKDVTDFEINCIITPEGDETEAKT